MNGSSFLRKRGEMGHGGRRARRALPGLLAALIALVAFGLAAAGGTSAAVGTIFTVDTTDGTADGICGGASDCSFGDAIEAANANPGKDTIAFGIPGATPHLIVLSTPPGLAPPSVTDALVIDGGTQPGYAGIPLVEIDTSGWGLFGLAIRGAGSAGTEIRGLAIHGGVESGTSTITFDNPGTNIVERNFIGTDASGTVVKGGALVYVGWMGTGDGFVSSANTIADNVIAGTRCCVFLDEVSDSQVLRNLIGTDASGLVGLSNGFDAVGISVSGEGNLLSGNVIANVWTGIAILGHSSLDNHIESNLIGTDRTGTVDLGNSSDGVRIQFGPSRTIVGGPDQAAGNVISGNGSGIFIDGTGDTVVQGNLIGTDITGTLDRGNDGAGIGVARGASLIVDNVVSGNGGSGVAVGQLPSVRIEGSRIGTNAEGTEAIPNDGEGIVIGSESPGNVVGGKNAAQRNVISGNGSDGVSVFPGVSGLQVLNNYIGTNKAGDGDLGNRGAGVTTFGQDTKIGQPGAGNLISGNAGAGVSVVGERTVVQGNLIGTDANGNKALGNGGAGVLASCAATKIGGAAASEGNLISGNRGWGVQCGPAGGPGVTVIERNRIGTRADGAMPLPNAAGGIDMASGRAFEIVANLVSGNGGDGVRAGGGLLAGPYRVIGNLVGTDASGESDLGNAGNGVHVRGEAGEAIVVGGTTPDDRNVISGNGGNGVLLASSHPNLVKRNEIFSNGGDGVAVVGTTPNTISENAIFSNGGLGIDLEDDGVTPNDPGDVDGGANLHQNFAEGLQVSADGTIVTGQLHSMPDARYTIEVFENTSCDPSGFGEGEEPIGSTDMSTAGGNSSFSVLLSSPVEPGSIVTATATDVDGNTSEFSRCETRTPPGTIILRKVTELSPDPTDTSFGFMAGGGLSPASFSLKNGESRTFDSLVPRAGYSLVETTPAGWDSTSACSDGSPVSNIDVGPGETVTCTFTNTRRPTLRVNKICQPANDDGRFDLRIDGSVAGTGDDAACGGTTGAVQLALGNHVVDETAGTGTSLGDYLTPTFGGDCDAQGTVSLAAGENKTCTITNVRRGTASVIKTVAGMPPTGSQSFTFQLRQGASTSFAGQILETLNANAGNGGVINFTTLLVPSATYQLCELVMPGWMTTLGPPFFTVFNPSGDNSTVCTDFTVQPGQLKVFSIDNIPPPGGLGRTIGFWKNWASCAGSSGNQRPVLDQTLAAAEPAGILIGDLVLHGSTSTPGVAPDCLKAVRILNKSTINTGKKMSSDPAFSLAAQLLAARLNVAAGAGICAAAVTALNEGQALLDAINFNGSTHANMTMAQKNLANSLAATLDSYNNNTLC